MSQRLDEQKRRFYNLEDGGYYTLPAVVRNKIIEIRKFSSQYVFVDIPKTLPNTDNPLKGFEAYLKPDWDGEGAEPVSQVTLENAQTFLRLLPQVPKVKAAPGVEGSIGLLWKTSDTYIYVDIYPDGDVLYYYKLGVKESVEKEDVQAAPFDAKVLYKCLKKAFHFRVSKNAQSEVYEVSSYTPKILDETRKFKPQRGEINIARGNAPGKESPNGARLIYYLDNLLKSRTHVNKVDLATKTSLFLTHTKNYHVSPWTRFWHNHQYFKLP